MFFGNDLPHELILTARQKTRLRNAFNNNKIIQSGGFFIE